MDRNEVGRRGEDAAAAYLARVGMSVEARNWRCPAGEIDIEFTEGGYVFVAYRAEEERSLKDLLKVQTQYGLNIRWLGRDEMIALAPDLNREGLLGGTYSRVWEAFLGRLRVLGYVEDQNLALEGQVGARHASREDARRPGVTTAGLFGAKQFGRAPKVLSELLDRSDVAANGVWCVIAPPEIIQHALTQSGHKNAQGTTAPGSRAAPGPFASP